MKKYFLSLSSFAFCLFVLSSCSVFEMKYTPNGGKAIVTKENPDKYEFVNNSSGKKIGVVEIKAFAEIDYFGELKNYGAEVPQYLVIKDKDNLVCIKYPDIKTKKEYEISMQLTKFSIPKEKEKEAWSRAISYINNNSDMKIQTQTDYMIETYNPITAGKKGFTITKEISGDEIILEVKVIGNSGYLWNSYREEQKCAYYIKNGK
jgi:hypothetical protein